MGNRRERRWGWAVVVAACMLAGAAQASSAPPVFQPVFHEALRFSLGTKGTQTFQYPFPVQRTGGRVRVSFRAGGASAQFLGAKIGVQGGATVPLTFNGGAKVFTAAAAQRVTSDAVALPVTSGQTLVVTFAVSGQLAAAEYDVTIMKGGLIWSGDVSGQDAPSGGVAFQQAVGLDTVEVEGNLQRVFMGLGDSITEGYSESDPTYAASWPNQAQSGLHVPFVNGAVSGQGVTQAITGLDAEVLTVSGVTDCIVLLGTNDLGADGFTVAGEEANLQIYFDKLSAYCHVWAGTLLPKQATSTAVPLETVNERRQQLNDWIRHTAKVQGIIDFESVTATPENVNNFLPGLTTDGVHPEAAGYVIMGTYVVKLFEGATLQAMAPSSGSIDGGATVTITGSGFAGTPSVMFDSEAATGVTVVDANTLQVVAPAHAAGKADVTVVGGAYLQQGVLTDGFTYVGPADGSTSKSGKGCSVANGGFSAASLLLAASFLIRRAAG